MPDWRIVIALSFVIVTLGTDLLVHRRQRLRATRGGDPWDPRRRQIRPDVARRLGPLPIDDYLAPCVVAAVHVQLVLLAALIGWFEHSLAASAAACVLAATRLRALQEVTHYAVHGSLTARRGIGLAVAAWLFQFPFGRATIEARAKHHVQEHHPHVNDPARDPNLIEYAELGFNPPLSGPAFLRLAFFPVTPRGLAATVRSTWAHLRAAPAPIVFAASLLVGALALVGGATAAVVCYAIPLFVVYPLLSWWSQLVEHRWFRSRPASEIDREYASGRVLNVSRLTRWCLEASVLPFGDSLHLAHSMYPGIRWNHLGFVHAVHMERDSQYRAVALDVVWWPGSTRSIVGDVFRNFSQTPVAGS